MADSNSFLKFVPGFDFLQGLVKNAGAALPGIGQWVAPTLNPEELEKRIEELRTVQFWLEQNARMLGTTIQALEVQRMTLSTLQTMNVPLAELGEVLKAQPPSPAQALTGALSGALAGLAPAPTAAAPEPAPAARTAAKPAAKARPAPRARSKAAEAPAAAALVDPMQWWSALGQQFTQLATTAMKDTATDAAKNLAGTLVKHSFDAAGDTLRKAAAVPGAMVGAAARSVSGTAAARTARNARSHSPSGSAPRAKAATKTASKSAARKR